MRGLTFLSQRTYSLCTWYLPVSNCSTLSTLALTVNHARVSQLLFGSVKSECHPIHPVKTSRILTVVLFPKPSRWTLELDSRATVETPFHHTPITSH
ncbi:hypothetical protein LY78DRAFT_659748 [Colletotrichum sublineola]|nr:hypothetical protein LY78DRAFT_659748 [Colletotrichum sublineola]